MKNTLNPVQVMLPPEDAEAFRALARRHGFTASGYGREIVAQVLTTFGVKTTDTLEQLIRRDQQYCEWVRLGERHPS